MRNQPIIYAIGNTKQMPYQSGYGLIHDKQLDGYRQNNQHKKEKAKMVNIHGK